MRDGKAAKHLLYDNLKVLARRRGALELVNARNFRNDVFLCTLLARKRIEIFEVRRSVGEKIAFFYFLSLFDDYLAHRRDAIFGVTLCGFAAAGCALRGRLGKNHDHVLFAITHDLGNDSGDAGEDCRNLWRTALEDFFDAWKTHGDIP